MRALAQLAVVATFALVGAYLLGYNPIALLGGFAETVLGWLWEFAGSVLGGAWEWFVDQVADALNPV